MIGGAQTQKFQSNYLYSYCIQKVTGTNWCKLFFFFHDFLTLIVYKKLRVQNAASFSLWLHDFLTIFEFGHSPPIALNIFCSLTILYNVQLIFLQRKYCFSLSKNIFRYERLIIDKSGYFFKMLFFVIEKYFSCWKIDNWQCRIFFKTCFPLSKIWKKLFSLPRIFAKISTKHGQIKHLIFIIENTSNLIKYCHAWYTVVYLNKLHFRQCFTVILD